MKIHPYSIQTHNLLDVSLLPYPLVDQDSKAAPKLYLLKSVYESSESCLSYAIKLGENAKVKLPSKC